MIKTLHYIFAATLALGCFIRPAEATLKFDVSKGVGKVTTTVSGWMEVAKKQMEQSATLQTMIAYGKGAVETAKKMKELQGAVGDMAAEAQSVVDESTGLVDGAISDAQNAVGGAVGDAMSQTGDAQELLELKAQKMALESERDDAIAAAQEEINGKISLAQENIGKLQAMAAQEPDRKTEYEAQIADYQNQISQYNEELQKTSDTVTGQYQSRIAAVDEQITALRDEAIAKAGEATADKLKSVFGGGDEEDAAAMNEMIKNNFLEKDDELTIENITPRQVYRKLTALKDTVAAFNNAWKVKKSRYENDERAGEIQAEVEQMDGASSSLGMDIQLKVENIKSLLEYTRMMVNDLKMVTAHELNDLNSWKLNRYDKDVTEFNLDDYIYEKESVKDKALDILKSVKENGVKGTAENMLNNAVDNKQNSASAPATTSDPLEAVRSELRQVRSKSGHYEGVDTAGPTDSAPVNVTEELRRARGGSAE